MRSSLDWLNERNCCSLLAGAQPPAGAYIVAPCPGAPAGLKCTAGTSYLSRSTEDFDVQPYGCCACRKTKASGPTTAYYGPLQGRLAGPMCDNTEEWHKTLPANTVVHFTGNVYYSYSDYGCPKNDYAEIVMPDAVISEEWASFFVPLADLSYCNPQRACGGRAELGATCDRTGCCNVAAEGGHPAASCYYPWSHYSACGVRPTGVA